MFLVLTPDLCYYLLIQFNVCERLPVVHIKRNEGVLDNYTTSLIHDGNNEIDDMEETNDAIPVNDEKFYQG